MNSQTNCCPAVSVSNIERNIDKAIYEKRTCQGITELNLPITNSAFPYIDPRAVRITPLPPTQPFQYEIPQHEMRWSFGCTNCIRNRNVIFSP